MHLCIDIGNTRTKIGVFRYLPQKPDTPSGLVEMWAIKEPLEIENLRTILRKYPISHCLLSSVTHHPPLLTDYLEQYTNLIELNHLTPLPIINKYSTPQTLGKDRLAAVVGGNHLYPFYDLLVIDAGTCIKYDFLDKTGTYWGGSISPGIQMRFKALHTFTDKLPLVAPQPNAPLTGDTTESAILSGVINGVFAEVQGIIDQYKAQNNDLLVIMTGGDAILFESRLKCRIFAQPNLVLYGLHKILIHNVNQSL
jgi:type III pantothenate kinase